MCVGAYKHKKFASIVFLGNNEDMRRSSQPQEGFITMVVMLLAVLIAVIVFAYMRVVK